MQTLLLNFPNLIYNCKEPCYDIFPFSESVISSGKIFASKKYNLPHREQGTLAVVLELKEDLSDSNYYKTIERLFNLICLSFGHFTDNPKKEIKTNAIHEIISTELSDKYYNPDVRYGTQLDWDLPLRISIYTQALSCNDDKDRDKFWRSLQTFCYARLIAGLHNPQYKYTLYLSLHLASINQLADEPSNYHSPSGNLVCSECSKITTLTHSTSHLDEILKLIGIHVVDPKQQTEWKNLARKLFHPVRSNFFHRGELSGLEELGGFMALWNTSGKLMESDINVMILNRMLLEKHLLQNDNGKIT